MKHGLIALAFVFMSNTALAFSELERGYQAYEDGDVESAVAIWSVLAQRGDSTAQLNLAQLYRLGKGVVGNDREAVKWYSMAAQQGSETAQYNLLMMQEEGRASAADLTLAFAGQTNIPKLKPVQKKGDWLNTLPGHGFLIQIIASSNMQAIEGLVSTHLSDIRPNTRIITTSKEDKDWYIAVMGPFATKDAAYQARETLPAEIKKDKPWIRSIKSIRELAHSPTSIRATRH